MGRLKEDAAQVRDCYPAGMAGQMQIDLETARQLTVPQEVAIVRAAYDRKPTPVMRIRLATLLLVSDAFGALVALLGDRDDLDFDEALLLAQGYLALETPPDSRAARAVADRALALATSDIQRAAALAARGKAETRSGDVAAARATLAGALRYDPHEKDACKRLAAIDLAAGDARAVLALADDLADKGAAHARLIAARALAQARAGDLAAARSTIGFDALACVRDLPPPPGWDDIHAFNAALAGELLAHPGLRYDRYGTASELTWRIDSPATRKAPLVRLLLAQIATAVADHVARVRGIDHPWAKARPDDAMLRSWCVITESDGFETWHVHQFGWLSGVYYVRVPDSIAHGEGEGGCLAFGLPGDLAGEEAAAAYGTRLVRPHDGLLMAFPSHTYHRTFPHGLREKRICVAFDLRPGKAI